MTTTAPVLLGGGTTASGRARSRWARWRIPLLAVLLLGLAALVGTVVRPTTSDDPLGPTNPAAGGARAVAEVLRDQGVRTTVVRTTADAVAHAREGTTLLVVGTYLLADTQVEALAGTAADLVLLGPEAYHLPALTDGALDARYVAPDQAPTEAACTDPDAQAAGTVSASRAGLVATGPGAVVCFPSAADPSAGAYASLEADGRRVVVLDDASLLRNDLVDQEGHAALVLRALGRHAELTWYLPAFDDLGGEPTLAPTTPPWFWPVAAQVALVVLVLAVWRGRRLGPVVAEPLPVRVRAAETTLGRGRLYRRARSRGHAAAALRAGTARRVAARLGLPRSAGADAVIDAVALATGRPAGAVAGLLYGPPPTDDAGLLALARTLDELESEVHHP